METLRSTIKPETEDFPLSMLPGIHTYRERFGMISYWVDTDAFDFHVDARPECPQADIEAVLYVLRKFGLEPLEEDECQPELLANGQTRIYLVPIHPVADGPLR